MTVTDYEALLKDVTIVILLGFWIIHLVRSFFHPYKIGYKAKNSSHAWTDVRSHREAVFCGICEMYLGMREAVCCDYCGVCVDKKCMPAAENRLRCKAISSIHPVTTQWTHHFVKGNTPHGAKCEVCRDDFSGSGAPVNDLKCCWCHRTVHTECQESFAEVCDFGTLAQFVLPPYCVELAGGKERVLNRQGVRCVRPFASPNWTPIIVLANRNSGNNDGGRLLAMFRRLLNPVQVIDLALTRMEHVVFDWCTLLMPGVTPTFLVAGGDGTIAWFLTTVQRLGISPAPPAAVIPLGTGNDLARVLGWGASYTPSDDGYFLLNLLQAAVKIPLDRWTVNIKEASLFSKSKKQFMYNYMSLGVDAQVALHFHRTRNSSLYFFSSRFFNKILYMIFGARQIVDRHCRNLEQRIEVFLDGERKELPSIEGLVVLNIPSWAAGVELWKADDGNDNVSFNDGVVEVVALDSSFHIAKLQLGLSKAVKIGRAKTVQIRVKGKTAMQIDGEPWMQPRSTITVSLAKNPATVLAHIDQSDIDSTRFTGSPMGDQTDSSSEWSDVLTSTKAKRLERMNVMRKEKRFQQMQKRRKLVTG